MNEIDSLLAADPYARLLGVEAVATEDGSVAVRMPVTGDHLNFHGVLHGGVLFSLADCAFSLASNLAGPQALAIDAHIALTARVGPGDVLTATAELADRGSTLGTYRVTVTRADDRVVGVFTGTVFIRGGV